MSSEMPLESTSRMDQDFVARPEALAPDGNTVFPGISRGLIVSCERAENTKGPIVENLTYRTRLAVGLLLAPQAA